ncbi:MAG: hypothetical protein RDU76_06310 [Candidatus Edwardsbacteria bacterium]|nr:hypothetical protein [Candidatus Edwardsbacteria bacterium]
MAKKKESNAGRKFFDGKDEKLVVSKLERMFAMGATDEEACIYAGISRSALDRYSQEHEGFRDRKALLKHTPKLRARITINRHSSHPLVARWMLERLARDEFGRHLSVSGPNGGPVETRNKVVEDLFEAILNRNKTEPKTDKKEGSG